MSKIIDRSEIPSAEEFEEDMDRSMTWTEKRLKKFLEWFSTKDKRQQKFVGALIFPIILGYTIMGHDFERFSIIDLLMLPFATGVGAMLTIALTIVKITSKRAEE